MKKSNKPIDKIKKNLKIPIPFEKIKENIEKRISNIGDLKEYVLKLFEYPRENYEIANIPIKKSTLGDKIGLVLSGGGARGIAHLGILKALEELKIKPSFIVGTSAGAIVGAFYSGGMSPDEMLDIYKKEEKSFKKLSLYKNLSPKNKTQFLRKVFEKYLPVKKFEKLQIKLFVNTTDINVCERIVFSEGDIIPAILASSAIPFVFEPVQYNGHLLVDGGLMDFFGIDIAREKNGSLFSNKLKLIISDVSGITDKTTSVKIPNIFLNVSKEFLEIVNLLGNEKGEIKDRKDMIPIINNLFYILRKKQTLFPLIEKNEFIISPRLEKMSIFDFGRYIFAYEKGKEAVKTIIEN